MNRPLTIAEAHLVRWMLENGGPGSRVFLGQLERTQVTPWRCPCGCASLQFALEGMPEPTGGLRPIADFVWGTEEAFSGIFAYERDSVLAGVEVYGLSGDAPTKLPAAEMLRPFAPE